MKYAVVDWWKSDKADILGIELTKEEAFALARQRAKDTNGECDVLIYDNEVNKAVYSALMRWIHD